MNKLKITFTQEQMQVLNDALIELPFKKAQPLIQHINAEIQRNFDEKADDKPSGQVAAPDEFRGD